MFKNFKLLKEQKCNENKINTMTGLIATFIGVFIFIEYIPQIMINLSEVKP